MPDRVFLDSNILVYAVAEGDPRRERAVQLLLDGGSISVQIINEFVAVARRKLAMPWSEIRDFLEDVQYLCSQPLPISLRTHTEALRISENHGYSIYDSLVIVSALEARCTILYSEDMQHGQVVDGSLTIRNPFAASAP